MDEQLRQHHFSTTTNIITSESINIKCKQSLNLHSFVENRVIQPLVVRQCDKARLFLLINDCMKLIYQDEKLLTCIYRIFGLDKTVGMKLTTDLRQFSVYSVLVPL